ncbi:hypothetical protein [Exiguobacterium sp. 17-1]|uniref:hypothetical protein n=1 Tax=Exiguobacterium sp. 17-1 TaxID=2931981 RepID=UPI001FFF434B|nr:hypothetical protein [Exiguobacterium sp. 17-1]MCK2157711.1 hypothetical protein [Exiguobacterium sp. 17-1]
MTGCTNNTVSSKPKPEIKQVTTTNQKINGNRNQILNHDQFKKLFEQMHEYLKIGHFQLEASTLGSDFTIIDRELSFGKRKWLTVDGTSDSSSSQESLYFEDEKQTTQLSIHFAFTDHYIGEDMVQYPSNSGYNKLNQKLANKSDLIIISYKNIVISVQQNTLGKIDPETTQLAVKRIINELKQLK